MVAYKCKSCLGQLVKKGNEYVCRYCGARYDMSEITPAQVGSSSIATAKTRMDTSIPTLSGEKIFEKCIRGSATVLCRDLECTGSGFLVSNDGVIITNAHVVTDKSGRLSQEISVTLNERTYEAEVFKIGSRDGFDVAFMQIHIVWSDAKPLMLGDSSKINNGETVYAIGNSLGDGLCIVKGIISDKERLMDDQLLIMCDIATNNGNSGGPLIDEDGRVIGMCVSQRVNGKYAVAGMRYFIPINDIVLFWGDRY